MNFEKRRPLRCRWERDRQRREIFMPSRAGMAAGGRPGPGFWQVLHGGRCLFACGQGSGTPSSYICLQKRIPDRFFQKNFSTDARKKYLQVIRRFRMCENETETPDGCPGFTLLRLPYNSDADTIMSECRS